MFAVRHMLEKAGHEVTPVSDGQRVLELVRDDDFDLILMDIQKPVLDGIDATRRIREDVSLGVKRSVPIVAMTAYAMSGDREKFLGAGMNDYVAKPVSFGELARAMARAGLGDAEGRMDIVCPQGEEVGSC